MRRAFHSAAPGRPSAHLMLSAATVALHAEVDARFSGHFDTDENAYVAFATVLARAVLPLERAPEKGGAERVLPYWCAPIPPPVSVRATSDEARLFGRLYGLEGSRRGGRFLVRRALGNADPRVRAATNYLGHGAGADLQRGFLHHLEDADAVAATSTRTMLGAREAFGHVKAEPADV